MPYEEANNVIGAFEPEGQCRYWTATNPRPTKEVFKTLFESFIEKKEQEAVLGSHMVRTPFLCSPDLSKKTNLTPCGLLAIQTGHASRRLQQQGVCQRFQGRDGLLQPVP